MIGDKESNDGISPVFSIILLKAFSSLLDIDPTDVSLCFAFVDDVMQLIAFICTDVNYRRSLPRSAQVDCWLNQR